MKIPGVVLISLLLFACNAAVPVEVRRETYLMGTTVSMETSAPDRSHGLRRLESFIRIVEDTERQLSTWQDSSALSILNRQALRVPRVLDLPVCRLLTELREWSVETGGAFDPTVGSLIDVWGLRGSPGVPGPGELEAALGRSGFDLLVIDPGTCAAVRLADVRLDAGAFGKGEALDRVASSDEGRKTSWMIDMGGQIMVHQAPQTDTSWSVDLVHPSERGRPVTTLTLSSGSLATSGGSEHDLWTPDGDRIGHIVDPRSGKTVSRAETVVVWNSRALVADVLSTALYVMGPADGLRWAEAHGIAACFLVPDGDTAALLPTRAFRDILLE